MSKGKRSKVVDAWLFEGTTGFVRGTRSQWFELLLVCNHKVERYASPTTKEDNPPKYVFCEYCK